MSGNYLSRRKSNGARSFVDELTLNPRNRRVEFHVDFLGAFAGNSSISRYELIINEVLANLFDFVNAWF